LVLTPTGQIEIEEFDIPVPASNQLLVRTSLTQVSAGSEMNGIRARRNASPAEQAAFKPAGLGYTAIGVVEAAGSEIKKVAVGDRVLCSGNHATHWLVTPELEASEVVIPQQYNVQKLPDDLTDVEIAFCVLGDVALHGVRRAQIQIGESVAVHGLGVVGLMALQLCRLVGAQPLIGVDLVEQRAGLEEEGLGVNVAQLVGHGSVRGRVMSSDDRAPMADELDEMRALVRAGMDAGAWGLSSGTFYTPGSYSENSELIELARVAAEYGGIYTSHIRDESNYTIGVLAAVEEVIDVSRQSGITGVVTHIKALGPPVWGSAAAMVERIEAARAEGLSVYADQYPYLASATGLSAALLPRWSQAGGAFAERVADPDTRARIREAMVENLARRGGADRIQFRRFEDDPSIEGRLLSDIAAERDADPIDVALELILQGGPSIVSFNMSEEDLLTLMTREWTMTSSDGGLPLFGVGVPHPRSYGAFARKIGVFVFQDKVMSLEAAVRSMTALPAEVMGMGDRGRIAEGMVADLVVFSDYFKDNATFTEPHQLSSGVVHLFVGGEAAILNSGFTGARAGQVLAK